VVTHNPDVAAASDVVYKLSYGGIKTVLGQPLATPASGRMKIQLSLHKRKQ